MITKEDRQDLFKDALHIVLPGTALSVYMYILGLAVQTVIIQFVAICVLYGVGIYYLENTNESNVFRSRYLQSK